MTSNLTIELAGLTEFNKVLELYSLCKYQGVIHPSDAVVIAKNDRKVIGAVRLCVENDINILRGMQIIPAMQRQKIGSQMLYFCLPLMQRQVTWCLTYAHLNHFYGQIGFQTAEVSQLPALIKERFLTYQLDGADVIPMIRPTKSRFAAAS